MSDRNDKILRLYNEGHKMKDIAAAVGMAPNSIVGILRKLGVDRPSKPQKRWRGREDVSQKVADLWKRGLCASQIVERVGVGISEVERILRESQVRHGQPPRHRYDSAAPGGSGRSGFAGSMARRT